jgi:hypothetical protein
MSGEGGNGRGNDGRRFPALRSLSFPHVPWRFPAFPVLPGPSLRRIPSFPPLGEGTGNAGCCPRSFLEFIVRPRAISDLSAPSRVRARASWGGQRSRDSRTHAHARHGVLLSQPAQTARPRELPFRDFPDGDARAHARHGVTSTRGFAPKRVRTASNRETRGTGESVSSRRGSVSWGGLAFEVSATRSGLFSHMSWGA